MSVSRQAWADITGTVLCIQVMFHVLIACRHPLCWLCRPGNTQQPGDIMCRGQGLAARPYNRMGHHSGRASSSERGKGSHRPQILPGGC